MGRSRTHVEEFDPQRVRPLPSQPRKRFTGIRELAESIKEAGQITPGIVTPITDDPKYDVQLVDGERRLRACKMAQIPFRAEVREGADPEALFAASFAANFGKQDHDAIEIAEALARIQKSGKTIEQMARLAGKSTTWVSQHLSLLKLHPWVQEMLRRRSVGAPHLLTGSASDPAACPPAGLAGEAADGRVDRGFVRCPGRPGGFHPGASSQGEIQE
ncbi:MAG TPA: ParB/RepB/Spo0J family partition protein [Edaphobacter sp.]|jgi:ParB family chromosome partitioning protein|nr:ParB/RepB/Spo0J family partition protein [Edaphobacter sp.]